MLERLGLSEDLWDVFSRREEYAPPFLDQCQRFPYYLSGYRDILQPSVSAYLVQKGLKTEYPNGRSFAVCLTHDIDSVAFPVITRANEIAQTLWNRQIGKSLKLIARSSRDCLLSIFNNHINPMRNFDNIMELEAKYGAKSTFYFLALRKGNADFTYRIERLKKDLRAITDSGWEIGLHGGHEAYNKLSEIREQKERLEDIIERPLVGYRNHFLRFKVPDTWELLREAGFKYDATFGYADCVGFRNGMCHPYQPFNRNTNQYIDIWEIPLAIMDATLINYMQLDIERASELSQRLIDTVQKYHGVVNILWHNASMHGEMGKLYETILDYCYRKEAWMTSAEEIWKCVGGNKNEQ